ncbi:NAD(P)-binding protein [Coniochaeta ligniaria NRRL 30616]|uniref:NAD(P)-binding protein n=1 Tax=Coniochaeta ligniaria NRRL 30616 TaxID=1408157 RepID=A0A1J7I4Z2_9PEZI|nr:NAD(P)-binding protein [Coniochaeta ligniaria NRRL 30616]
MAGSKVLVFGGTGPAGICLLRELLHRKHQVVAYVRNPSKIPQDLAANPLLEIIQGQLSDLSALEAAVAQAGSIISLVGPSSVRIPDPNPYIPFYSSLFPLMRKHGVKRILAMSTVSAPDEQDGFALIRWLLVTLISLFLPAPYHTMLGIAKVFREEATGLDWTVFRLGMLPGGSDEASWAKDRGEAVFAGYIGGEWKSWIKRGALARWLVDTVEVEGDGAGQWIGKLPAVSKGKGGKVRTE